MYKTFNMGVGFLVFARPEAVDRVYETVSAFELQAYGIGTIEENSELVQLL
jgi:phosphoribosylaminoimidazole (AIR) synthetase